MDDRQDNLLEPRWRESVLSIDGLSLDVGDAGLYGNPILVLLQHFPEIGRA